MHDQESIDTLRTRLQEVVDGLKTKTRADTVTMLCYDQRSDRFCLPVSAGLIDTPSFKKVMPRSDRLAGKIAKENMRIVANTIEAHPEIDGPFSRRERIKSVAGEPIIKNGKPCGVVFVSYRQPHRFKKTELALVEKFASKAAKLITDSKILEWISDYWPPEQTEEQKVLQGIAEVICSALNMPVAIWLRDRENPRRVKVHAATGILADYQDNAGAFLGDDSIVSIVMNSRKSISIKNIFREKRFKYPDMAKRAGWHSLLAVPLRVKTHVIGAIEVFSLDPRKFSRTDLEKVTLMIDRIGLAIENYRRIQELQIFNRIVQTLGTILDPEKALKEVVDGALTLAQAGSSVIYFFNRSKDGGEFRIASQSDMPHEAFSHKPRETGGLARYIIDTGRAISIVDTHTDGRVHPEVIASGIRSIIGVPIEVGTEKSGVLFVTSSQPLAFGDYDVELLRNLAGHAAAALQRMQLLEALKQIEHASSRIFDQDKVTAELLREISQCGFDFAAVQLIDRATNTIATVHGVGIAQLWIGLAKHRTDSEARDIQADIATHLTIEIISGWDPRFDKWIFDQFDHQRLIRIFAPIYLVRDEKGGLYPPGMNAYEWDKPEEILTKDGRVLRIHPAAWIKNKKPLHLEVIGTVEAGFQITQRNDIRIDDAKAFHQAVCAKTQALWEIQLNNVLDTIVKNAMHIISADSASLHLLYDPAKDRYSFLAFAGKIGPEFLAAHSPRKDGIGHQAIRDRETKVIDTNLEAENPGLYHLASLKENFPDRYKPDEGIRAIGCFPLIVSEDQYGVLYLHFWREHHFSSEELEWGKLFAEQAVAALKNTLVFQQKRQDAIALDSLHAVGQFLVSQPKVDVRELLQRIAQRAINVLNADVVIVYLYDQQRDEFPLLPPLVEGRLFFELSMKTQIDRSDVPSRIVREIKRNYYAPEAPGDRVMCDRLRVRPEGKDARTYVDREQIKSSAGIIFQVGTEIVGIMFVNYRTRHEFTQDERRLIETFASAAAIGIYNARLFNTTDEELRERLEELTARVNELHELQEVGAAITYSTTDVKSVLKLIAKGARSVLDADVALIVPYDAKEKIFHSDLAQHDGLPSDLKFDDQVTPDGVAISVLGSADGVLVVDDVAKPPMKLDIRPNQGFLGQIRVRSFLGVALRVGAGFSAGGKGDKETVGVLYIDFLSPHDFKKQEIDLAQMFGNYAATAIAASRAQQRKVEAEKLNAINVFGARFAHRVGNLLGTVPVNFKAVESKLNGVMDDTLKQHIDLLRDDVQKIQRLLNAARNLRRFEANARESVKINDLLEEMVKQRSQTASVEYSIELDHDVPSVAANQSVLTDILSDMIDNALYAMSENGGRLTLATRFLPSAGMVEIRVSDTGCGIPPEVLARLRKREPFFSTKEANLGLGVWLCHQVMEQMGGKLLIESRVNAGTSFIIHLPALEDNHENRKS
jgi:GAF domain-containing protein